MELYNLDVIISVGYKVKCVRGTQFQQRATQRLKELLISGYTGNQQRLLQLQQTIRIIQQTGHTGILNLDEAKGLLDIIKLGEESALIGAASLWKWPTT